MTKKLLITLVFIIILPIVVFGVNRFSAEKGNHIVYIYADGCGYCEYVWANLSKFKSKFGNKYQIVKVNAYSRDGFDYVRDFNIKGVPYIIVYNEAKGVALPFNMYCARNYDCLETEMLKLFN